MIYKQAKEEFDASSFIVVLDEGASWENQAGRIAHWADMDVPDGHISIPLMVEKQSDDLRTEYLRWIHDLGEHQIDGRSLREHLELDKNFSFWWMTLIAEKSPVKSPGIYMIFKLRVLEQLYSFSDNRGIVLCSGNRILHRILSDWCQKIGHPYRWVKPQVSHTSSFTVRKMFRRLPHIIHAIVFLFRKLWTVRLLLAKAKISSKNNHQITIVTYFPNIDQQLAEQGIFRSRYWEDLHSLLDKGRFTVNWVWIYAKSDECSFKEAVELRQQFVNNAKGKAYYYFIEEFLSFQSLMVSLKFYLRLLKAINKLKSIRNQFHFTNSSLNFFDVMAQDWKLSLMGVVAMNGCLQLANFQNLAKQLPHQELGLYVWENQPWERALIWAWKNEGHGKLIGFQHAILKPLNLRSFEDRKSYKLSIDPPLLPDILAVSGNRALRQLNEVGFPEEKLKVVEALRYMYLAEDVSQKRNNNNLEFRVLLVVTGYSVSETSTQLDLLAKAGAKGALKNYDKVLIKPHPYCPVDRIISGLFPDVNFVVVNKPLKNLWSDVSMVYTANSTAAAVEAAWKGLPVIISVPNDSINLSPFYGLPGVTHVSTVDEFVRGLNFSQTLSDYPDFLCLENELPRWANLLKSQTCS